MNAKQSHTQGKVHVAGKVYVAAEDGQSIARMVVMSASSVFKACNLEETAQANAERFAACWNACEGISTEDLIRIYGLGLVPTVQAATEHERDALRAEVARLRAENKAFRVAAESLCGVFDGQDDVPRYVSKARAALGVQS